MRTLMSSLILIALFRISHANSFEQVGDGCVHDNVTYTNKSALHDAGAVKHMDSDVSTITLYCGIPTNITAPSNIEVSYKDNNSLSAVFVSATYIKMNKTTGVTTILATASSDSGTQDGAVHTAISSFTDTYDVSSYFYYVSVSVARVSVSDVAIFYGVRIY
jgi:hypothetical protein